MQAIKSSKIYQTIFLIFFTTFIQISPATAQSISENNSSTEIGIENNLPDQSNSPLHQSQIFLTEVNFKNDEEDFLKFKVYTTSTSLNLKGLQFYDDKVFKTIEQDFLVKDGDEITLYFNLTQPDNNLSKEIFTDHTGLTATSEQIILKQDNFYFDYICWQQSPISKTEQVDFQKTFQLNYWDKADITSCLDSSKVAKNQSLLRQNNSHISSSWTLQTSTLNSSTTTPNTSTDDVQQSGENPSTEYSDSEYFDENNSENSTNQNSDSSLETTSRTLNPTTFSPTTIAKKTPTKKTTAKSPTSNLADQLANITPDQIPENQPILITEIMPAPAKAPDAKTTPPEWIELYNQSGQDIDLENWIIDDSDGGSKPHLLQSQIFPADSYLLLYAPDTKLNLNNSSDQVRLFDPELNLIDAIEYQEAEKNSSYARLIIDDQTEWSWQKTPTPGQANPTYISLNGTITSAPIFDQNYHFQIQTENGSTYTITFDETIIKAPLAKNLFTTGTTGKFIGILNEQDSETSNQTLQLNHYQLKETPPTESNNSLPTIIIGTILALVIGIYFLVKNKNKWISGLLAKSPSSS